MFLKLKESGELIKIDDLESLIAPTHREVEGCGQEGRSEQPPVAYAKEALSFPSGEDLPRCWWDADYRQNLSL